MSAREGGADAGSEPAPRGSISSYTPRALHSPRISRRSTVHSERRRSSQPVTSMAEGGAPPVPRLNLPKDSVESFRGNLAEDSYTSAATFSGRGSVSMRKPAG